MDSSFGGWGGPIWTVSAVAMMFSSVAELAFSRVMVP